MIAQSVVALSEPHCLWTSDGQLWGNVQFLIVKSREDEVGIMDTWVYPMTEMGEILPYDCSDGTNRVISCLVRGSYPYESAYRASGKDSREEFEQFVKEEKGLRICD